jgi:acyl-CoA thioester hydrolase
MNDVVDLTNKDSFRHWTPVTVRFSDQDPLQHVNNVAYAAYFEAARTMFLGGLLNADENVGIDFILARVVIDFVKETHYPNTVDVGTRVSKLGTKSITTGFGCFVGDECVATSESVNVFFSTVERKTVIIPDAVRVSLEADPMQEHNKSGYGRNH